MVHDVFLSFRGEDTRNIFVSHLYRALCQRGIVTYKDDRSLEVGSSIKPGLLQAIEKSRFAVVVLSSNFATSKWCLEEIAKIVECKEQGRLIVIPVFYHVDPSDVRHQSNCFQQGFANHEADPEVTPQKVKTWRSAFEKVGGIKGEHVTSHRNESEVVCEIIRKIFKSLQDMLPTIGTKRLVGIESRLNDVKRLLSMESSEVLFIGICGMSGIGKTTLAEAVYADIQPKFQESSFVENIKDISKHNDSTSLCKLQQKILDDILKEENIRVQSVKHGQTLLETRLRGLKVIIVLDDVNHLDQLTYLAGEREWFGPGTRIIVTTTNMHLLNAHKIDEIYRCEELKDDEALRLFCQSAFKEEHPTHACDELIHDMVKLAGGLPLALNIYGSLLCGKEENYWKEMLRKHQDDPQKEVLERLEIVFARLDKNQRDAITYIACFLKGRNKDLVIDILANIGLYPVCGIDDLINRFLIIINHDDSVWMHDLIQQMCWVVIRKKFAIKDREEVVDVLSYPSEDTRITEIINQEPYKVEVDDYIDDPTCFSKMRKLKFLRVSNIHFRRGLNFLSSNIRILEWDGCSLKSLPSMFEPTQIYELEMRSSQLETLWKKYLDLPNLRSINLSFSKNLTMIPDLTSAVNLVKLNLEGCSKLTKLHESIILLRKVRYMNLKGCTLLTTLGRSTMEMESLEALLLSGCSNLEYIPELGQSMKRLEHLYVDGTRIKKLPGNLGKMCDLRKFDASETFVEELPAFFRRLKRLRFLRVHGCKLLSKTGGFLYSNLGVLSPGLRELDLSYCNLSVVPEDIGSLYRLMNLDLSGNDFVSLPASLSLLSELRMLCLNNCKRLQSFPKLSIVNEDTLLGRQIRFNYHISGEGLNVPKVHITSDNSSPTISCLNCPKLAKNESGRYLAEKILNNYLQLRTNHRNTPEAVFEIVGAGSEIPSTFEYRVGDGDSILKASYISPWIGVAICAVVSVHHVDASMEAKYMVTAHIHVGEHHCKIPVPVNFLMPGLKNQLVFYSKIAAGSSGSQSPHFSFSLEPKGCNTTQLKPSLSFQVQPDLLRVAQVSSADQLADLLTKPLSTSQYDQLVDKIDLSDRGYLEGATLTNTTVTAFGVRFIHDKEILQLKQHDSSTSRRVHTLFQHTFAHAFELQCLLHSCEADTDLHSGPSFIHDLSSRIRVFILEYEKQDVTLDGIHTFLKCLLEVNQGFMSECMEEWRHAQIFPLVYDYCRISHGTSELYNDFVKLLKEVSGSWLSAKLALEQIVVKSRADHYNYEEKLQQLNDLEAAKSVRFSDDFVTSVARICKQTVMFARHLNGLIQPNKEFKSMKVLEKLSYITIAGVLSVVATYIGNSELLQAMKDHKLSNSVWVEVVKRFIWNWQGGRLIDTYVTGCYCREMQIWDFNDNATLLQELKKKIAGSADTKKNDAEMMIVIIELEKKIDDFSKTIEDMSSLAHEYSSVIRKAGMSFNQFIADGELQVTKFGVLFGADEDILQLKRFEDPMREAVSNLFRATVFLPADMHSYISADVEIRGHQSSGAITSILEDLEQDPYRGIVKVGRWFDLPAVVGEPFSYIEEGGNEWLGHLVHQQSEIRKRTIALCHGFQFFLSDIAIRWTCVAFSLERILKRSREGDYIYGELLQKLSDVKGVEGVGVPDGFVTSFEYICDETAAFFRSMNSVIICHQKELKTHAFVGGFNQNKRLKLPEVMKELGNTSSLRIIGVLSLVATCMGDFKELQENVHSLLHLIQWFSRKSREWFNGRSDDRKLRILGNRANANLLQELKKKMNRCNRLTQENIEEMIIVITKLRGELN